ncbi:rhomboid family intramembrane serine protease [uncultured Campylobacter sp.]|uniref:rhomboid family intramembrane serine protease n=1 Tax=uncultured Campylobacter sp. TaxID=218934 RepID=UPI002623931E|nr:rhomboid family intramembrane serine protease [uncultured Campylobacter sp.]
MFCIALIISNCILYFLIPDNGLYSINVFFMQGAYWQIISSMFMHANLTHLALNMIVLYQFGYILEKHLGSIKFAILYMFGGILTSLLSAFYVYYDSIKNQAFINLVGASGAICVLIGFYAYADRKSLLGLVVAVLIMSFVPIFMGVNVAWYAHIFGFICGYLIARLRVFV